MTAPKPLAVGDRVLQRPTKVWTVEDIEPIDRGFVWLKDARGHVQTCEVAVLERIDPAPPAVDTPRQCQACDEQLLRMVRTLTAERDAARAEVERLRAELAERETGDPEWDGEP